MSLVKRKTIVFFLLPAMVVITAVTIYPLIYSISVALRQWNVSRPYYGNTFVGLRNFHDILTDEKFWNSLRVTGLFVFWSVFIEFLLALGLALLLYKEIRGKNVVRAVLIIPMIICPSVVALIWKYMLNDTFGILSVFLKHIGFENVHWYGDIKTALPTMILIDVWEWTAFLFIILLSGLVSLPIPLFEAARIDGANNWKMFRFITLPLMKPVILVALFLRTLDSLRTFDIVWILTRGGPSYSTELISVFIFREGLHFFNVGYASAISLILLLIVGVIFYFFIRISKLEL
jgi:multiple sugar transport system permease protein